jgi:hypothetical protein
MSPTCGGTFQQSIDCSAQPLDLSFHPNREYVMAAALADGTIESESNSDRDALLQNVRCASGTSESESS